jgi:thiosulfate/3-mercaptopyruvate sulfurtransferase
VSGPLVTSAWLRDRLDEPLLRVVDCRYKLGQPGAGESLYLEGHIPRAAYLDMDRDLASPPGDRGRHPLPDAGAFEAAARAIGISEPTLVVAYDEAAEGGAARLWWLLRHFGHDEVTVLDGGLRGWREEGGPLEAGTAELPAPGAFTARPREGDAADSDALGGSLLLDARAPERYRGEVEPIDPRAGHVPGAVSAPTTENLAADGTFRPATELRARFADLGVQPGATVGVYCGSGVTAAHEVAALAAAGIDAALWPGSWSQWSADPDRPAASGD